MRYAAILALLITAMPATAEDSPQALSETLTAAPVATSAKQDAEDPESQDLIESSLEEALEALDFDSLARDAALVPALGADMAALDAPFRAAALREMARIALDSGDPAAFRKIMAAYVDPAWQGLSDTDTAANIISWMPDTAEFLGARLSAALYLGQQQGLTHDDLAFLWKDLRARVERVGQSGYMDRLLKGMALTGHAGLAVATIDRNTASTHERMLAYVALLDGTGPDLPVDARMIIVAHIEALRAGGGVNRADPGAIALAYWKAGLVKPALALLEEEQDPVLRLRARFRMLSIAPPAEIGLLPVSAVATPEEPVADQPDTEED